MNKRRRFKAKRRRLVRFWQDHYNHPWRYAPWDDMHKTRSAAIMALKAMAAWQ